MELFLAISFGENSEILNAPIGTPNKELNELVFIKSIVNLRHIAVCT
jgi:hypothetical protein